MPREKVSDQQFLAAVRKLMRGGYQPKIREIAEATGLSEGGAYYKMKKLRINLHRMLVIESD